MRLTLCHMANTLSQEGMLLNFRQEHSTNKHIQTLLRSATLLTSVILGRQQQQVTSANRQSWRTWHLVVHLAQCWCHLVGEGAGHNHGVTLARTGTEDDAKPVGHKGAGMKWE